MTYDNCPHCGELVNDQSFVCRKCHPSEYLVSQGGATSQQTSLTSPFSGGSHYDLHPDACVDPRLFDQPYTTQRVQMGVPWQQLPVPEGSVYGAVSPRPHPFNDLDGPTLACISRLEQSNAGANAGAEAVTGVMPLENAGLQPITDFNLKAIGYRFNSARGQPPHVSMASNSPLPVPRPESFAKPAAVPRVYRSQSAIPKPRHTRAATKRSPQREEQLKMGRAIMAGSDPAMHCCGHDWVAAGDLAKHQRWCQKRIRITAESASGSQGWYCKDHELPFAKEDDLVRHLHSTAHPETAKTFFLCPEPGCKKKIKVPDKNRFNAKRHLMKSHGFSKEKAVELSGLYLHDEPGIAI